MAIKTFKLKGIVEASDAIGEIQSVKLAAPISFLLSKMLTPMIEELQHHAEVRNKALQLLGSPLKDNPNNFEFTKENAVEFTKQMEELDDCEVDFNIVPIELSKLGNERISSATISMLVKMGILVERSEAPKP